MNIFNVGHIGRCVSALESMSTIHLGTYFGNLRYCLESQNRSPKNSFLFVADLHYLSSGGERYELLDDVRRLVREFIALGIDPARTVIYRQSDVPEILELMWLLSCHCPMQLAIAEEEVRGRGFTTVAQHLYPILMAADVLGVRASRVTVGPDEERRVKFAAKVADIVNAKLRSAVFPAPRRDIRAGVYVPGVDGERMQTSMKNVIPIFGDEDQINHAIDQIRVLRVKKSEPINPDMDVTFQMISYFMNDAELAELRAEYVAARIGHDDAKDLLRSRFFSFFDGARVRRFARETGAEEIDGYLAEGRLRVRHEVRQAIACLREAL